MLIFTLHRYVFSQMLKVFVPATLALTILLSAGLLVPTIMEFGVGPGQILRLLGYFLPVTLTFVVPMGALFSAAMVYGRLAAERELDACRASGISLLVMIYPAICLAMLAAAANLLMSFYISPAFIHRSEQNVKANAEQILFRNILRKGYYALPRSRFHLYAEQIDPAQKTMEGVVIVESRPEQPYRLISAQRARVHIDTHKTYNRALIAAQNAWRFDPLQPAFIGQLQVEEYFPPLLGDNIKFKQINEIKQIQADLMQYYPIREKALSARRQLAAELLCQMLQNAFANGQSVVLTEATGDRQYRLKANGCVLESHKPATIRLTPPVVLEQTDLHSRQTAVRYESQSDRSTVLIAAEDIALRAELDIDAPAWHRDSQISGRAMRKYANDLLVPAEIAEKLKLEILFSTLDEIQKKPDISFHPSDLLTDYLKQLEREIVRTQRQIAAEVHSRLVMGLGTIPILLLGVALGIWLKGGHLLSAFGTSSIPAGILVVFIMAGKQLIKNPAVQAMVGIWVIWAGIVLLAAAVLVAYHKLLRT